MTGTKVKRRSFGGLAVIVAMLVAFATAAGSAEAKARPLFGEGQAQVAPGGSHRRTEVRSRRVKVDVSAVAGADLPDGADAVELNLFTDKKFEAVKSRFNRRDKNHFTWFGKVADDPSSSVVLVGSEGRMRGLVFAHGKHFSIRGADAASQVVVEFDQSAFPKENCDQSPAGDAAPLAPATPTSRDVAADAGSTIDVLVVYTPAAESAGESDSHPTTMRIEAEDAINFTNASYASSGISTRLTLVRVEQVAYTESGSFGTDLSRVQGTSDGFMDEIHALRDAYRADVVVLLIKNPTSCGIANIAASEDKAFAVVAWDCAVDYYSFGHEIGHLQGARHDRYVDPVNGPNYAYNHGDVDLTLRKRTIMAYNDQCKNTSPGTYCYRLGYWSNPEVPYPGSSRPTGSYTYENNALVLNNTAYTVANFRLRTVQLTVQSTYPAAGVSISPISPADNNGTSSKPTPFTLDYDANTSVTLTAVDMNGDGFSFLNWSGCATVSGTSCTVTMDGNKTVTANYDTANYLPTLDAIADLTINEDAGAQTIELSGITAGGGQSQTLSVTMASSDTGLIPIQTVDYTSPGTTGSLSFTPVPDAYGTATITVTVDDGQATYNTFSRSFLVTVNAVNDAPSFLAGTDQTVLEDDGAPPVDGWATIIRAGPDNESAQTLSFTTTNNNNSLFSVQPAVAADGTLTFTPASNASGSAEVTVRLHDSGGTANGGSDTSAPQYFTIAVTPVNDPPTLNTLSNRTISEGASWQTVALSGISAGGGESQTPLTVTAVSSKPWLIPDPTVTYTSPSTTGSLRFKPEIDAFGTATITVTVDDGQSENNTFPRDFVVTVNDVNDPPTLNSIPNVVLTRNAGEQTVALEGISAGVGGESQPLTVKAVSSRTSLIPNPTVIYKSPDATGSLLFTPTANSSGSATITVTVKDWQSANNTVVRKFVVTVNNPPTLNALGDVAISEDAGKQIVALSGITAGAGERQGLKVTAVSSDTGLIPNPRVGYRSPRANGSLSFRPRTNASGVATITVTVNDGQKGNNTVVREFVVTVNAVNDVPTLNAISNRTIKEDAAMQTVSLGGITAGGGESQALAVTAVSSNTALIPDPTVIYTSPGATGSLTFLPLENMNGKATITVTVNDGQAENNTRWRSFVVTVKAVNDAPGFVKGPDQAVLVNSGAQTVAGWATGISAGPANESAQTLSFITTNDRTGLFGAQPKVAADGTLSFRPATNKSGSATVTVRLRDNGGTDYRGVNTSAAQTFTITMTPPGLSDAPLADEAAVPPGPDAAEVVQTAATAAEFQAALDIAAANGRDDIIRLAGGVYALSGNAGRHFAYSSTEDKGLVIEGGWTPDFNQSASNIPTELRSDVPDPLAGSGGVLEVTAGGSVSLNGITITGGQTAGSGGGVQISAAGAIVVGNCLILNNVSGGDGGGLFLESTGGEVRVYGSTIQGNSGAGGGGALVRAPSATVYGNEISGNEAAATDGGLQAAVISGGSLIVGNNTIYGNRAPAGSSGLRVGATGARGLSVLDIHNNIVYGNGAAPDFVVAPDTDCLLNFLDLNVVNNDIACYETCPEYLLDGSNIGVDFSGRAAGTFRLSASDTALIDRGSADTMPLEDIEGDAIPLAGAGGASAVPDIGADEYNPENIAGPASLSVTASGSIAAANGSATITVMLDAPAKRDLVLFLNSGDPAVVTVTTPYLRIFKGSNSAQTVVRAASGATSGSPAITVTDPSGRIAPGSVNVSVDIVE